jgi:hypothetical protein
MISNLRRTWRDAVDHVPYYRDLVRDRGAVLGGPRVPTSKGSDLGSIQQYFFTGPAPRGRRSLLFNHVHPNLLLQEDSTIMGFEPDDASQSLDWVLFG